MLKHKKELDQFFTSREAAKECFQLLSAHIGIKDSYLEPSAGDGALLDQIPEEVTKYAFDIDPKRSDIVKKDFFTVNQKADVVFMNPPFGKRSKLAIEFFNRACSLSKIVAQIVPVQFQKWGVQSKLDPSFKLIYEHLLKPDSFVFDGKPYKVRCCFQIWVSTELEEFAGHGDLRFQKAPDIKHPDFDMWQYNNTVEALKVFKEDFDFAVPRQGYQNYSRREKNPEFCEKNKQWILFKARDKNVLERLFNMDFDNLSKKNTSTPGFGKADVVQYYKEVENNDKRQ